MDEQREQPTQQQQQHHQQLETQQEQHNATTTFVNQSAVAAVQQQQPQAHEEDAWWWEVENGDLILDLVPNVDAANSESENISSNNDNNYSANNELTSPLASLPKADDENADVSLLANNTNSNGECKPANAIAAESNDVIAHRSELLGEKTPQASDVEVENNDATCRLLESRDVAPAPSNAVVREQTLEEFKEELRIKRLARQTAVQDLRDEISTLRRQLAEEQELTRRLRRNDCVELSSADTVDATTVALDEEGAIGGGTTAAGPDSDDEDPQSRGRHANIELANAQLALQMANAENLSLRTELGVVQKQVGTLKEVIACCKQMLNVKEEQCVQLKSKLDEIETAFGERELKIMSSNLRQEYERQLGNIRQLRQLYEERQRIALAEQENLQRLISIKRDELTAEQQKTKNFEEHNQTLMKEIESANNELAALREECNEHKFEKKALKEEMGTVNMLFSQMVMGFNGENNLDIDRLTMMLEENRGLLNDMAIKEGNCTDGATLPKLLFELVEQAALSGKSIEGNTSPTPGTANTSADEEAYETERDVPDNAHKKESIEHEEEEEEEKQPIDATAQLPTADKGIDHNNSECKTDEAIAPAAATATATVALSTGAHCGRKHHRRSTGMNRMKLPAAASSSAATESSTLKIHEPEVMSKVATTQEIIGNLPKVWKVLMELLSHHKIERVQFQEHGASEDCYKSVETANGPKAELSVSKTYIKLKDLILEKKSLVKETNRLKTLNCHLEYRLNEQEKRLSAVSLELTKTWHLVGKMQRQHRQLHTQEQILRYQLQQKRRLLTELKDELEYCRRKWAAARAKNDESQEQWNDLRREFALRKLEHANNSAESGYSDSGQASDDEMAAAATGGTTAYDTEVAATSKGVGGSVASGAGGAATACRRKRLKEMFEHTRKIKRMQSTSPGRAADDCAEIVLRWNSAPPTCGWRDGSEVSNNVVDVYGDEDTNASGGPIGAALDMTTVGIYSRGAIPKNIVTRTRHRSRREGVDGDDVTDATEEVNLKGERAERIQRLEEQCKTLIQRVLETSDNRERLEVQLRSFQDEIAPVQYVVPLNEVLKKKPIERMKRASSVPVTGTLTPREEEYTRKRSERLGRLEEESRQLLSRIKRTADRGHYLRCSLDRLRRGPSREGSFESNTEEESSKSEEKQLKRVATVQEAEQGGESIALAPNTNEAELPAEPVNPNPLTANEEAYTARRSARLQRLENESKELLNRLTRNNERGTQLGSALDALHEQHGVVEMGELEATASETATSANISQSPATSPVSIEQRLENIEQISSNRMERLRILEEEGKELLNRLTDSSARGTDMIKRIAAREQNRQASSIKLTTTTTTTTDKASSEDDVECATGMEAAAAVASLLPTPNNIACSSIVPEELEDHVTVTTTPSQIAAQKGAIPKQPRGSSTGLVLNAAIRAEAANNKDVKQNQQTDGESLEDMVRRLRETPFPEENNDLVHANGEEVTETAANEVTCKEEVPVKDVADENKANISE